MWVIFSFQDLVNYAQLPILSQLTQYYSQIFLSAFVF